MWGFPLFWYKHLVLRNGPPGTALATYHTFQYGPFSFSFSSMDTSLSPEEFLFDPHGLFKRTPISFKEVSSHFWILFWLRYEQEAFLCMILILLNLLVLFSDQGVVSPDVLTRSCWLMVPLESFHVVGGFLSNCPSSAERGVGHLCIELWACRLPLGSIMVCFDNLCNPVVGHIHIRDGSSWWPDLSP